MSSIFINRRRALRTLACLGSVVAAVGAMRPLLAANWNKKAFEAMKVEEAIRGAGIINAQLSDQININAPEIAENGAQVPMDATSMIPDTERIFIFSDKNVQPYVANFAISKFVDPFISTRIKMGESSNVRVYVLAGGKYYYALREVKVTIGGCGS